MPESTLALTYEELQSETGRFLGFGGGTEESDSAWTTRQTTAINNAVKAGIRMFYFPAPLPGDAAAYDWSFMRPSRNIAFASGASSAELPDDFGGMEGSVQLVNANRTFTTVPQTNEQRLNVMYASFPDVTGQPQWCAVRLPATTSQTKGQRANLYIYPIADQDYTLQIQYYILPDALSTTFPYALGGATHAETIKAACLAAAELDQNYQRGVRYEQFVERMRASVSLDRRNKAQTLGLNLDHGYNQRRYYDRSDNIDGVVTVNGVTPT